jgi:hypothetical protein
MLRPFRTGWVLLALIAASCGLDDGARDEVLIDEQAVVAAFGAVDRPLTPYLPADPRVPDICSLFNGNDVETGDLAVFFVSVFRTNGVADDYDRPSASPNREMADVVRRLRNVVIYLPRQLSPTARRDIDAATSRLRTRAARRDPDSVCPT